MIWSLQRQTRIRDRDEILEALEGLAGHSHKPRNEWIGDVLCFNPGCAGPGHRLRCQQPLVVNAKPGCLSCRAEV